MANSSQLRKVPAAAGHCEALFLGRGNLLSSNNKFFRGLVILITSGEKSADEIRITEFSGVSPQTTSLCMKERLEGSVAFV